MKQTKLSNRGFTLLELLVVVGITGTLSSISLLSYKQYRDSTYITMQEAIARQVVTGLETIALTNEWNDDTHGSKRIYEDGSKGYYVDHELLLPDLDPGKWWFYFARTYPCSEPGEYRYQIWVSHFKSSKSTHIDKECDGSKTIYNEIKSVPYGSHS